MRVNSSLSCATSVILLLLAAPGCEDSSDDSTGSGTDAATPDGESSGASGASGGDASQACSEACVEKAGECGAPADVAAGICEELCGGSVTQEQVDCLAGTSCEELTAGFISGDVCGLGGGGSADSGSSGTSGAGDDSGPSECVMFGDDCAVDGVGIQQCCQGLSCSDGACCVPQGSTCSESADCCGNVLAGEPVQCIEGVCTQV